MSQPGTYPQPASHDPYEQAAAVQGSSAVQQAGYPGSYPTPGSEPAYVQALTIDPVDDEAAPEGGPDLVDEADWIDQRTDAPLDDPEE